MSPSVCRGVVVLDVFLITRGVVVLDVCLITTGVDRRIREPVEVCLVRISFSGANEPRNGSRFTLHARRVS